MPSGKGVRALALLLACSGLCACELIADFDRGKLDAGAPTDAGGLPPEPEPDVDSGADTDAGE